MADGHREDSTDRQMKSVSGNSMKQRTESLPAGRGNRQPRDGYGGTNNKPTDSGPDSGMKSSGNFVIRLFAVLIVIMALGAYQFTATVKAKDTEITQLQQELTQAEGERDKLEEGVRSMSDKIKSAGLTEVSAGSENEAGGSEDAASETQASETENNSPYNDGDFEGEAQGYGGTIKVKVTISGGEITDIDISEHANEDDAYFQFAKNVTQNILDAQSTDVDTIAGATMTSKGIKDAVAAALKNAEK